MASLFVVAIGASSFTVESTPCYDNFIGDMVETLAATAGAALAGPWASLFTGAIMGAAAGYKYSKCMENTYGSN